MSQKLKIFALCCSMTVMAVAYQNCTDGFQSQKQRSFASVGTPETENDSSSPLFFIVNTDDSILPEDVNWNLEWSDEFDGLQNQKPQKPWVFFRGFNSDNTMWRDANYSEDHAFTNGAGQLVMRAVIENGQPATSFIRTTAYDNADSFNMGPPDNLLLDPSQGPLYIETSVDLSQAYQSEDGWWAFWLQAPDTWNESEQRLIFPNAYRLEPYDGNPATGTEIDIFEYVPYLGPGEFQSRNGFNAAVYNSVTDPNGKVEPETVPGNNGFFGDVNRYLRDFRGINPSPEIDLTDGQFHKIGLYWDLRKYEFYIDGYKIWEVTDPNFITQTRANAIIMSWEVQNGTWEGDAEVEKTFVSTSSRVSVAVDYVRVFRGQ